MRSGAVRAWVHGSSVWMVEWVSVKEMSGVHGWRCDANLSAARTRLEALRVRRTVSNVRRHMQLNQQHDRQ